MSARGAGGKLLSSDHVTEVLKCCPSVCRSGAGGPPKDPQQRRKPWDANTSRGGGIQEKYLQPRSVSLSLAAIGTPPSKRVGTRWTTETGKRLIQPGGGDLVSVEHVGGQVRRCCTYSIGCASACQPTSIFRDKSGTMTQFSPSAEVQNSRYWSLEFLEVTPNTNGFSLLTAYHYFI